MCSLEQDIDDWLREKRDLLKKEGAQLTPEDYEVLEAIQQLGLEMARVGQDHLSAILADQVARPFGPKESTLSLFVPCRMCVTWLGYGTFRGLKRRKPRMHDNGVYCPDCGLYIVP